MEITEEQTSSPSSSTHNSPEGRKSESSNIQQTGEGDDSNNEQQLQNEDSSTLGQLKSWIPLTETASTIWNRFADTSETANAGDDDTCGTASQDSSSSPPLQESPLRSYGMAGEYTPQPSIPPKDDQLTDENSENERRNSDTSRKIDEIELMAGTSDEIEMITASGETSPCNSTDSMENYDSSENKADPKSSQTTENNPRRAKGLVFFKVIALVLLVVGAVVYFVTRSSDSTVPATFSPSIFPSMSPSSTFSPSSSPTLPFLFDPPLPDDCGRVQSGETVQGQELWMERNFDVVVDVAMVSLVGLTETMEQLELEMKQTLIPMLVGCGASRKLRHDRMLSRNINRYIVGNGKIQFRPSSLEGNTDCSSRICLSATFSMDLFLKTEEDQFFVVVDLFEELFGGNLVDLLQLERALFVSVTVRSVVYNDPTKAPSTAPSLVPSDAPSHKPTQVPSQIPTAAPTRRPTFRPTPRPTLSPSASPSASPSSSPTFNPTTPPPTMAPSTRPSSAPTRSPSRTPTREPSIAPTPVPTFTPSVAPTQSPTTPPPTRAPSVQPTRAPTTRPSQMPTRSPTTTPSSSPTGFEDRNGYFRQLDRPLIVACAGDSLTRGRDGGNPGALSYPNQLEGMLGESFRVFNYGRNAVTAMRGMSLSYVDKEQFQSSLDVQPDIYLLMLGTNDSRFWVTDAHRFPEGLEWIVNKVRSIQNVESRPRIILAIPPWVKTDNFGIRNTIVANNVRAEIQALAQQENLQVVNMHDVTVNQNDIFVWDGVHLNADGYRILAEAWKVAIQCNLNGVCEAGENCETCPSDCYLNCPSGVQ